MGGCRLLPRSCVPPNLVTATAIEQEDEQVVRDFIDQVWNYEWLPGDWYHFLPVDLRNALFRFLDDPDFFRYRRTVDSFVGLPRNLNQGNGRSAIYGLGGCVRKLREISPNAVIRTHDLMSRNGQVLAVLTMTGPDPQGRGQFQSSATVLYRLGGAAGNRRIVEDWALSDGFALEF